MNRQFERGQLTARDFINAFDLGVRDFFLAVKGGGRADHLMEFYVEDKKQIRLNAKNIGDSVVYIARWDDVKGVYVKDGSYLKFSDVNLVPVEGCPNFIFRRYDRARECAGLEFTGEGKAPPAPTKKVSTKQSIEGAPNGGIQIIDMTALLSRMFGMPGEQTPPTDTSKDSNPPKMPMGLEEIMKQLRAARKPNTDSGDEKPTA